jgi:transposase-like protein
MQTMEGGAAHEQIRAAVEGDGIVAMEQEGEVQPVLAVEEEAIATVNGEAVVAEEEEAIAAVDVEAVVAEEEEAEVEEEDLFARAKRIRTTKLLSTATIHTTCESCVQPMVCWKCGVRGDHSIFVCTGCKMPLPKPLRSCELCGNKIQPKNSRCKDCATVVGVDEEGICMLCHRSPSELSKEEENDLDVPDTAAE